MLEAAFFKRRNTRLMIGSRKIGITDLPLAYYARRAFTLSGER